MKNMVVLVTGVLAITVRTGLAQAVHIESLSHNGTMAWTADRSHGAYQIQWSASLTEAGRTTWHPLVTIPAADGVVTNDVPMFFRVVTQNPGFRTNGLVAHYTLNGHANDDGPFGNHGTTNAVTLVPDRFGMDNHAMAFLADESVVTVPRSPSLDLTTDVTLCAWVKPGSGEDFRTIIDKEWNSEGYDLYIIWGLYHTRYSDAELNSGRVELGQWAFVVSVREGETVTLYINGQRVGESWCDVLTVRDKDVFIGNCGDDIRPFGGAIDDIRIYNRALSLDEIMTLYYAPE